MDRQQRERNENALAVPSKVGDWTSSDKDGIVRKNGPTTMTSLLRDDGVYSDAMLQTMRKDHSHLRKQRRLETFGTASGNSFWG